MGTLKITQRVLAPNLSGETVVDQTARDSAATGIANAATAQAAAVAAQADIDGLEAHSATAADSGQKWTDGHAIFRKVVAVAAGPNATSINVAHSIATIVTLVRVAGMLKSGANRINLPYVSGDVTLSGVGMVVNATNIVLKSAEDMSGYAGHVILEYTVT